MQPASPERSFPRVSRVGELETLVHFPGVRSLVTLLLRLSLISVCLA